MNKKELVEKYQKRHLLATKFNRRSRVKSFTRLIQKRKERRKNNSCRLWRNISSKKMKTTTVVNPQTKKK
jgi:hypothetical protein